MRYLGLIVTFWLAAIAVPTNSLALGLGEIEVNSFLNQPLDAEIQVISARPGEIDDLLVSLASREAFTRAGLSRPRNLTELRFAVRKNEAGDKAVIVVTTKSSVKEPFLNFLIEADWSKGRVLREFTVLLDPPFYAEAAAAVEVEPEAVEPEAVASNQVETADSISPTPDFNTDNESIAEPIAVSDSSDEDDSDDSIAESSSSSEFIVENETNIIEGDVQIVKGDTLWSIASRFKDADHSMAQVMLAIQRTNPGAFGDNNINNLKVGSVLRAPSAFEIDALSQQEAYATVLEQNGLWDDYVSRVTGTDTSPSIASEGSGAAGTNQQSSGELSLVVPGDGDSNSTGTADGGEANELRTKLAIAEEELDATRVENSDLESKVAELQARLSKLEELQKMVQIEDDSLAKIQSDQAAEPGDVAQTEEALSETMNADEEALLEELLAEEAAAQAQEESQLAQASDDVTVEAPTDTVSDDGLSDDLASEEKLADDALVDEMQDDSIPPTPVIITEPASKSGSILDGILPADIASMIPSFSIGSLLGNPVVLGAVGGIILLLLILLLLKRRKSKAEDEEALDNDETNLFADDDDELTPIHLAESDSESVTNINVPNSGDLAVEETVEEEEEDDFSKTAIIPNAEQPSTDAPDAIAAAEQDDVLNEVDVYLAYGLYDNAEDLLKTNLSENPGRADYRSKLLDTYFATKNTDAFVKEAETLKSMGEPASRYWDRVLIMGFELAPDNALFSEAKDSTISAADLEIAKPQAADFDLGSGDDDETNFSATDFNLGDDALEDLNETQAFGDTQVSEGTDVIDALPDLDDDTNLGLDADTIMDDALGLPDDIGNDLDFDMKDEVASASEVEIDDDAMDFELPDSLDLGSDDATDDDSLVDLESVFENADESSEEDLSEFDIGAEFDGAFDEAEEDEVESDMIPFTADDDTDKPEAKIGSFEETAVVASVQNFEETSILEALKSDDDDISEIDLGDDKSNIDLGMDDTSSITSIKMANESDDLLVDLDDDTDAEDISVIDFGGDDFDIGDASSLGEANTMDVDSIEGTDSKTGTFAPGDFDDADGATVDMDDIESLMLPDDVDEVSTKLDLARAFIDMGDTEGARGSLEEVMSEGNDDQKTEAKSLLDQI